MTDASEKGVVRALWLCLYVLIAAEVSGCGTAGRVDEAEEKIAVAARIDAAERALAHGDYDTAVRSYQDAYARTPWNPRLARALAAAHVSRAAAGRRQEGLPGLRAAEADLRAALELLPDDATLRRNLAVVLVELAAREGDPVRAGAMREQARALAPDVVDAVPVVEVRLERQLDMAHELIERGQLDAAIQSLEGLAERHPEHSGTLALLARAHVREGSERARREDLERAGASLDRAVGLYRQLDQCQSGECEPAELATAHENRIRVWLHAGRPERARRALAEAEAAGLRFPELRRSLPKE